MFYVAKSRIPRDNEKVGDPQLCFGGAQELRMLEANVIRDAFTFRPVIWYINGKASTVNFHLKLRTPAAGRMRTETRLMGC